MSKYNGDFNRSIVQVNVSTSNDWRLILFNITLEMENFVVVQKMVVYLKLKTPSNVDDDLYISDDHNCR